MTGTGTVARLGTARARLVVDPMQRSAVALAANSVVSALLGFVYWIVAARLYDAAVVGATAALLSTVQLLATVAEINLNNTLIRFLPTAGSRSRRVVARAYLAVIGAGLVVGAVALPVVASLPVAAPLTALGPAGVLVLLAAVPVWALFVLQGGAAIGARAAGWVLAGNTVFGVAKLVLLVVLASSMTELGVLTSWAAAIVLVVLLMAWRLFVTLLPRHERESADRTEHVRRRDVAAFMTVDHATLVATMAGVYLLPAVVVAQAGSAAGGYFYAVWAIHGALDLALVNVTSSLVVEGARQQDRLGELVRSMLRRLALVAGPAAVLLVLAAPALLSLYGSEYSAEGADLLRIAAVALLARAVLVVWMSAERVRRRLGRILAVQAGLSVLVLGLSWWLVPAVGIIGVGVAYLLAQLLGMAAVLPTLRRLVGRRVTEGTTEPSSSADPSPLRKDTPP